MTRGKGNKINPITGLDRSLSIGERTDIQGMKAEAEATLKLAKENPMMAREIDKVAIQKEIERYDAILHEGAVPKLRGTDKDRLIAEARKIEDEMMNGMPTREEMDHPNRKPGAVQKHIKWDAKNKPNILRLKEIMRQLEPDDPTATSYERLRREK